MDALLLRPPLLVGDLGQVGRAVAPAARWVLELDDHAVGSDLPVVPSQPALEVGEKADGAVQVLELPRIDRVEAPVLERADEGVLSEAGVEVPRLQGSNAPPQSGLLRPLRSASLLPRHEERAG